MSESLLTEQIRAKFPHLPYPPKVWAKNNKKRLYYNKRECGKDYSFYIDISNKSSIYINLTKNSELHPTFPQLALIQRFVEDFFIKEGDKVEGLKEGVYSEFYAIDVDKFQPIYVYELTLDGGILNKIGGKISYYLRSKTEGFWNFSDGQLISNLLLEKEERTLIVHKLWESSPDTYKYLQSINFLQDKIPSARAIAEFVANLLSFRFGKQIREVLNRYRNKIGDICIIREAIIRGWVIENNSAVSISIKSHIYHSYTLDKFIETLNNKEDVIGLRTIDIEHKHVARILGFVGSLKEHRQRLLMIAKREFIRKAIMKAPDSELVLSVGNPLKPEEGYYYIASTLYPLVTTENLPLFRVTGSDFMKDLTMSPDLRYQIESEILNLFKQYLGNNYNSISHSKLFTKGEDISFSDELKFGNDLVKSEGDYVVKNLKDHGLYKLAPKYSESRDFKLIYLVTPQINQHEAVSAKINRELSEIGFNPIIVKTVLIKQFDRISIENAIKSISPNDFDVIVGILPNRINRITSQDKIYELFKSALFTKNFLQSQFIFQETIQHRLQYAVANVILGILSKTDNIPFVLAKPLSFADFFVGIDISREKKKALTGSQNYAAVARIYGCDGTLHGYNVQEDKIEGETVPKVVLERIFAKFEYTGKIIMIHRDGLFRGGEISDLKAIGEEYDIEFRFVEVIKRNVPRLLQISNGKITNVEKNQVFFLRKKEALIVNTKISGERTAKPLRVVVRDEKTKLNDAIVSVMALRMMHFGSTRPSRLPVTISFSDRIAGFIRRGIKPNNNQGKVAWWY